jgi:hypothetical protein
MLMQVHVADIASGGKQAYTFTPSQPYINEGIGYGLWPSVALAPGAQVSVLCYTGCCTAQGTCFVAYAVDMIGPMRHSWSPGCRFVCLYVICTSTSLRVMQHAKKPSGSR